VPEQVGAGGGGVFGYEMAAFFEQAAALDRKQGGAADGQVRAELRGREPEVFCHRQKGRQRCGQAGSTGGYRRLFEDLEVLFPEAHALKPGL